MEKIQLAHGVLGECTKSSLASGNLHVVKNLFFEKIVAVDNGGNFTVRDGNKDKIDWNFSKYQLTFTIKNMALKDQAKYGVHVELGLDQSPLEHFVNVKL